MNLEIVKFEDLGVVELHAQELQEVEGGHEPCFWAGVASVAFPWGAGAAIAYVMAQ